MAVNSATLQLVAAVSALTFVLVTGVSSLLGLGPALFLTSAAMTSFPAGRLMDRVGRVPVLAGGFLLGSAGAALTALGAWKSSAWFAIIGYVLFGAVFGAILGPAVFSPLFKGRQLEASELAVPWLAGAAMMLIALVV